MSVQSFYETVHTLIENDDEFPSWESLPSDEIKR